MRYKSILANGKTPLIIDAGANNGCSAVWFATQFPQAKIMAVEPDHQNASLCRRNTAKFQQITVAEAAIGCISGFVRLENPTNQPWAVRTTREGEKNGVPVITVNDILESSGPACALFILKIDIEGFESDLFGHNTEWLDQVTVVMIEPHDWMLPGQFTSLPFQRALTRHKFEILLKGDTLMYVSG